ncbi:MAG: pyridoxamine 5'-phosphate oxidase family protein [Verrucomicrobia bacterium]|nr:pyridoxamine 5'-phosphate oxidase family protein [Verrucomicrobiota bacterium]MBV8278798.1 pyridoxamine 5'-phosphate oxidase family protein [Verrucomicrobiota bacterium]
MNADSSTDLAFTPAVKAIQERRGSRGAYAKMEARGGFPTLVTPELEQFIAARNSFYLATASADGRPYMQHKGGPKGFLKVLDERTLAFADYSGNRQYISIGNLAENPRVFLFLMDYENQERIKIWGRAEVVENDPDLISRLMPENYRARPEQAIVITVEAWDGNCKSHIPHLIPAEEAAKMIDSLTQKIDVLESRLEICGPPDVTDH